MRGCCRTAAPATTGSGARSNTPRLSHGLRPDVDPGICLSGLCLLSTNSTGVTRVGACIAAGARLWGAYTGMPGRIPSPKWQSQSSQQAVISNPCCTLPAGRHARTLRMRAFKPGRTSKSRQFQQQRGSHDRAAPAAGPFEVRGAGNQASWSGIKEKSGWFSMGGESWCVHQARHICNTVKALAWRGC